MPHSETVQAYVRARCDARLAHDRYKAVEAARHTLFARNLFVRAALKEWAALDAAKTFLESRSDINSGHLALSLMPVYGE